MASHRDEIARLEALYAQNPAGRVFAHLAEAYRKAGELERARELLEQGLKRHPDYASAHVVLGRVHLDGGDSSAAQQAFGRVLDLDPHNLVALRAQGDIARGQGRRGEALQYYNDLAGLDPGDERVSAAIEELSAGEDEPVAEPTRPDSTPVPVDSERADAETREAEAADAPDTDAASGEQGRVLDDPYEDDAVGSEPVHADAGVGGSGGPAMASADEVEPYEPPHGGMDDDESYEPSGTTGAEASAPDQGAAEEHEPYEPEFLGMGGESSGSAGSGSDAETTEDPFEAYGLTGDPEERADAEDAIAAWVRAGEAYEREEAEAAEPEAVTRAGDSTETREMDLGVELEPTDIGAGFGAPASPADERPASEASSDESDSSADATLPPPDEAFPDAETASAEEMTLPPPDEAFPFEEAPGVAPDAIAPAEPFQLEDEAESADAEPAFQSVAGQPEDDVEQDDVALPGWDGEDSGPAAEAGADTRDAADTRADMDAGAGEADSEDMAEAAGAAEPGEPGAAGPDEGEPAAAGPAAAEPDQDARPGAPTAPEWAVAEDGEAAALPDVGPELVTETIGDLYARQGLHDLAADVYRKLLERRPDDDELQRKLNESEAALAGVDDTRPARPEWSTVEETRVPPVTPGAVAASEQAEASALESRPPEEREEELTGFTGEDGEEAGVVDAEELGLERLAEEAVGAADQEGTPDQQGAVDTSDLGLEPVGGGADLFAAPAEREEGKRTSDEAPVEEVEAAWTGGSGHDEPAESPFGWTDTADSSPAAEESIGDYLSGLLQGGAPARPHEPPAEGTAGQPQPADATNADAGGGTDEIDALFADVEPSGPKAAAPTAGAGEPDPAPDAVTAREPDEIDALFGELGPAAGEDATATGSPGGAAPAGEGPLATGAPGLPAPSDLRTAPSGEPLDAAAGAEAERTQPPAAGGGVGPMQSSAAGSDAEAEQPPAGAASDAAESSSGDAGSSDADGDDEDLEMFRDWLQSLKR